MRELVVRATQPCRAFRVELVSEREGAQRQVALPRPVRRARMLAQANGKRRAQGRVERSFAAQAVEQRKHDAQARYGGIRVAADAGPVMATDEHELAVDEARAQAGGGAASSSEVEGHTQMQVVFLRAAQ